MSAIFTIHRSSMRSNLAWRGHSTFKQLTSKYGFEYGRLLQSSVQEIKNLEKHSIQPFDDLFNKIFV
ncbi:hypothetical protein QQG55_49265 [Brugia pahangi]|uniref:Transposase n=1 Tax=Brugia pahangi TaxID=6280 RepID=A0A0N4TQF2_BRUPA|nr:unnamed protein product [Brugia pahangi]